MRLVLSSVSCANHLHDMDMYICIKYTVPMSLCSSSEIRVHVLLDSLQCPLLLTSESLTSYLVILMKRVTINQCTCMYIYRYVLRQ